MDNELAQAEKALMEVSRELWESRNYREDEAFNIAAFKLTTGERRSQEEIEKIIGDPENPKDSKLYEKFCENFELVAKAGDSLKLMGSLPYCHPSLLPLKEYGDEPTLYNRFSGFVERNRKGIMLGLLALMLTTLFGAYQIPQMKRNQRIEQLKREARLSEEQALSFDNKYGKFAQDNWFTSSYNQTIVDFGRYYGLNSTQADEAFNVFQSFKRANEFLSFVTNNGYDGLRFLRDCRKYVGEFSYILPVYSMNSTLSKIVLDQIERDYRVKDKVSLIRGVFPLYLELGREVQSLSQIYTLNNATSYFKSSEILKKEIGSEILLAALKTLGENDGLNRDFDNARKHANLLRLAKHVENILKYPKEWREGAIQVDDVGYKTGLAEQNETKFWYVVEKAVKYIVDKLDKGEAEYELSIPDEKLEAWYRRQRLLPRDFFEIDIVSGYSTVFGGRTNPGWVIRNGKPSLEVGWRNVSQDERIGGKIPQEWLDEMAKKDLREKNERYLLAIDEAFRGHPAYGEWPNSDSAYKKLFGNTEEKNHVIISFDGLMKEDEVAVFIQGYPRALGRGFIPWNIEPLVPMEGQTSPHYSVLVARVFGRAAFVLTDKYPNSVGYHDEPFVVISSKLHEKISQYGKTTLPYTFGWWQYSEPLIKDHAEGKYRLDLQIRRPDGEWEKINP